MGAPDLPVALKTHLASPAMRDHHAIWHFVRAKWKSLTEERREEFRNLHWEPPRLLTEPGSGLDFLGMHARMVAHTRQFATNQGIKADLAAWNPIPWDHNDRTWPMPPDYPPGSHSPWKQNEVTVEYRDEAQTQLLSLPWLRTLSLDALGIQIETGIHNWLHLHWSADPWYRGEPGQDMNDIRNDWLADPYSSHVNKHFWKLHGWIDDRVRDWGFANEEAPDLSSAWCGPPHTMDPKPVLTVGELRLVKTIFFEGFNVP